MTPLRIAFVCPLPWPPVDDVAWQVSRQAEALAARGHRVTILTAGHDPQALREGRDALEGLAHDPDSVRAPEGSVRVLVVGRALRTPRGGRVTGPIDLAAGLERAVRGDTFDIVHVHEPLSPTPFLTALRRTRARTVATFHRRQPLKGTAFVGPLVLRALARLDARVATTRALADTLSVLLPGEYEVIPAGVGGGPHPPPRGSGVLAICRARDRSGLRFALTVARMSAPHATPLWVVGPDEAPWRTRAAVPKALREHTTVLPRGDRDAWLDALDHASVVMAVDEDDALTPLVAEARARGHVILHPRRSGDDEQGLPPFNARAWSAALAAAHEGARTDTRAPSESLADVAATLEGLYTALLTQPGRSGGGIVTADLRVRPVAASDIPAMAAACRDLAIDVVAVASPEGVCVAHRFAEHATGVQVVPGQEVATREGVVVGLFLREDVTADRPLAETLKQIRDQGGVSVIPHPAALAIPSAAALRSVAALIDCRELSTGALGIPGLLAAQDAQALGMTVTCGSGAEDPGGVGSAGMVMNGFRDASEFVAALADAEPTLPRRGRRARTQARQRRGHVKH